MPDILVSPELLSMSFGGILLLIATVGLSYRIVMRRAQIGQLKPVPIRHTGAKHEGRRSNLPH